MKTKVTYAEFVAAQEPKKQEGTVAWLLARYYEEWKHRIGASQRYTMGVCQRAPIGSKLAAELKPTDLIEHCRLRQERDKVQPQTVQQDITYMRVAFDYAKSGWDMPITAQVFEDAMPTLVRYGLISKARPRDRRPTGDEFTRLEGRFRKQDLHPRTRTPMAEIQEFQVWSARRIGETCRILFEDVNEEKRTVVVRDMKDPKKKKGNHKEVPLLGRAWEIVAPRLAAWKANGSPAGARVFPYSSKTCSARYTLAKKELGIKNLRLHDLRREAASRLFEAGYAVQEVMMVTGHATPIMLLRVYTKLKPEDLHKGPAAKRGLRPDVDTVVHSQHDGDARAFLSQADALRPRASV